MRCHFGEETALAETRGGRFHGIRHLGATIAWSADEGLFVVEDDGAPERLGPPCTGGIDAIERNDDVVLACVRRAAPDADKAGHLELWRLGSERSRRVLPGSAGPESEGVALAYAAGRTVLAWHDGTPQAFHVWRHVLDEALRPTDEPERVSSPRFMAGAPTALVHEDRAVLVWAEHWAEIDARYRIGGHVVLAVDGAPARSLVEVEHPAPHPVIAQDGEGLVLLFRDHRAPLDYPSVFGHRLTSDLRLHGGLRLIGRADEGGPIRTFGCEIDGARTQVAVVARSWGKEDTLVAAHLLDDELSERFHELQVYEWGGQLALGDGVCEANSLELLIAERTAPPRVGASLFTIPARCAAGAYP